jgi:starch phosphorylase
VLLSREDLSVYATRPVSLKSTLPKRISRLSELAYNLWWSWHLDTQRLFERIDGVWWEASYHNPIRFLNHVERKALNAAVRDNRFTALYDRVIAEFDAYMSSSDTWFSRTYPDLIGRTIAYFSMEFGLHESLPIYAGGLGVLSGDHCKTASDFGLPFVGVGFLYPQGYFRQRITEDGWQEAYYENLDLTEVPVVPVIGNGKELLVQVAVPERTVCARIWKVQIGRVPLYLMDTDIPQNAPNDRELTTRLYLADPDRRISQEIVLGIGGVRLLRALGIQPAVWHMNEGHSAFQSLERLREFAESGQPVESALRAVRSSTIFTTHTPVPAGVDIFPQWLVDKYFGDYWGKLGLDRDKFMDLARQDHHAGPMFNMGVLAIRMAGQRNAVSELHRDVSRKMWHFLWPDRAEDDIPIGLVTNGIHTLSWIGNRVKRLYDEFLGPDWVEQIDDPAIWDKVVDIPDEALWSVRKHLKRKLMSFIRERARQRWIAGGYHPVQAVAAGVMLDPAVLTIGFARRFATYKRANLLMRDVERLKELVNAPDRHVQIVFAGKAHPADDPAKHLVQDVYRTLKLAEFGGRIAFIEDYDINVARYLVQGVDVWLNTPRRPNEASGTSGQKATVNGVLNFSVLDGWWREGYNGKNGWAIGEDGDYANADEQDAADAESLYEVLENEIVPLYYDRDEYYIPRGWLQRVKESIRTLAPMFSTSRMVKEYTTDMYVPAAMSSVLKDNGHAGSTSVTGKVEPEGSPALKTK